MTDHIHPKPGTVVLGLQLKRESFAAGDQLKVWFRDRREVAYRLYRGRGSGETKSSQANHNQRRDLLWRMEMNQMSQKSCLILGLAVGALLAIAPATLAEKPEDPGGKPKDEPGGSSDFAVLYGDLYVLERDGNGVPVTRIVTYDDPEYSEPVDVDCLQPIAEDCSILTLWGEILEFNPELYDPCEIHVDDLELSQEVSFGRQSVVRTDPTVIDNAYFEALKVLNSATPYNDIEDFLDVALPVRLDPAGRFEFYIPVVEGATGCVELEDCAWKTIDSPLENLGLYRALMLDGCLMPVTITRGNTDTTNSLSATAAGYLDAAELEHLICGLVDGEPAPDDHPEVLDMLMAAAFWGGAADKTSPVALDEFINANTYLGINSYERVGGTKKKPELEFTYFDFTPFSYDRAATHPAGGVDPGEGLPPIPSSATVLGLASDEPTFEIVTPLVLFSGFPGVDLEAVEVPVCRGGVPSGPCLGVFEDESHCGPANYFGQATEDARKIVWFVHNWHIPEIAY